MLEDVLRWNNGSCWKLIVRQYQTGDRDDTKKRGWNHIPYKGQQIVNTNTSGYNKHVKFTTHYCQNNYYAILSYVLKKKKNR